MNSFKWNDKSSVGIEAMDNDHKELFDLINSLYVGINQGFQYAKLDEILLELLRYSRYHFEAEESLMRKYNYPELQKHIDSHVKYVEKIGEIRKRFTDTDNDLVVLMKMQEFLREWWINHIESTDKKYGEYLASIGVEYKVH